MSCQASIHPKSLVHHASEWRRPEQTAAAGGHVTASQNTTRPAVMADVAKLAGVSHQTVSRVLNGHPSVRPDTRERVLRAVTELSYRPNALARGLAQRRSRILGVVSFDTILFGPASTLL